MSPSPHITQAARRGDAPAFLSICHVLEFEDIYKAEAKDRKVEIGKQTGRGHKRSCANGTEPLEEGSTRTFMARDSAASEHSIQRVLYIKAHDPARFNALTLLACAFRRYRVAAFIATSS